MTTTKLAAGLYQGKTVSGQTFTLVYKRHWEVEIDGRRFMPYETKAQALNSVDACAAAPEKGYAAR